MGTIWGRGFGCILAKPTVRTHVHALATHMSGRGVFHGVRGSHSLFLAQHSKVCDFIFLFFCAVSPPLPPPLVVRELRLENFSLTVSCFIPLHVLPLLASVTGSCLPRSDPVGAAVPLHRRVPLPDPL